MRPFQSLVISNIVNCVIPKTLNTRRSWPSSISKPRIAHWPVWWEPKLVKKSNNFTLTKKCMLTYTCLRPSINPLTVWKEDSKLLCSTLPNSWNRCQCSWEVWTCPSPETNNNSLSCPSWCQEWWCPIWWTWWIWCKLPEEAATSLETWVDNNNSETKIRSLKWRSNLPRWLTSVTISANSLSWIKTSREAT